jgi:hypothetical protein
MESINDSGITRGNGEPPCEGTRPTIADGLLQAVFFDTAYVARFIGNFDDCGNAAVQPSLLDLRVLGIGNPPLKRWAISNHPCRDGMSYIESKFDVDGSTNAV